MFVFTAKFSRRNALLTAFLILALAAAAALVLHLLSGMLRSEEAALRLTTNEERVTYLQSWGWEVNSEPLETFQLLLPDKLPESYQAYNRLQQDQGFDLRSCCGKQLTRYTYAVTNYPNRPQGVQVNLYICEESPAAGDIIASGAGGFQAGLAYPEET